MIELRNDTLRFEFHWVHDKARCTIDFHRTLRIPDDNRDYPLPPGLGRFPIEHVDDYADNLPPSWQRHGGVFIPMYQSEALWIAFNGAYPCAVKIAAGKINAVTGEPWDTVLSNPPQDYVVLPEQPWLDGFHVSRTHIRQFVAMPLGHGFTAEEQITGEAVHGGLQLIAFPMRSDFFEEHIEESRRRRHTGRIGRCSLNSESMRYSSAAPDMGLAPGGLMKQSISRDPYGLDAWDLANGLRCFVHLLNSEQYHSVTGNAPPHQPPTAQDYTRAGLPWFDYFANDPIPSSGPLNTLHSVAAKTMADTGAPLSDNDPLSPRLVQFSYVDGRPYREDT